MDGIRIGDFEETHLAEFAERLSWSQELSEVEAGLEILQVGLAIKLHFRYRIHGWNEFDRRTQRGRSRIEDFASGGLRSNFIFGTEYMDGIHKQYFFFLIVRVRFGFFDKTRPV